MARAGLLWLLGIPIPILLLDVGVRLAALIGTGLPSTHEWYLLSDRPDPGGRSCPSRPGSILKSAGRGSLACYSG